MSELHITREFRFEGAHALTHYDGKCRHIHGHSYRLMVTITGEPSLVPGDPKSGMILDFNDLKKIVSRYILEPLDHSLMLRNRFQRNWFNITTMSSCSIFSLPANSWSCTLPGSLNRSSRHPTGYTVSDCMKPPHHLPNG